MKLRHRLGRLEQRLPAGCPACRHRRGLVALVTARGEPDASWGAREDEPRPCAACGEVPEQIIEIVELVIDSRSEVARPSADAGGQLFEP
jgi:hypothetical protein